MKELHDTTGKGWFDMEAPKLTPELETTLRLMKMRPVPTHPAINMRVLLLPPFFFVEWGLLC